MRPDVVPCTDLPHPAQLRSGSARPSAFQMACTISCATNTVFMVIAAGGRALTMVPAGASMVTQRKVPSLRGMSGSKNVDSAVYTAE